MPGLLAVFRKELADHLGSKRFVILFALIFFTALSATYVAAQSVRDDLLGANAASSFVFLRLFTASNGNLPPFIAFIGFLGPLVGLALGFDAINSEQARGTLSRVLSQPIFRDSVINGKFLAGVATVAAMIFATGLIVAGMGLRLLGVPPTIDEISRMVAFLALSVVYVAFWMGLAILFSIFFRQTATSALAGMAVWIFCTFFVAMIAGVVADAVFSPAGEEDIEGLLFHENAKLMMSRVSPTTLYQEVTVTILTPNVRTLGPVLVRDVMGMISSPLPLAQSLMVVWPQLVGMVALTLICFAVSYIRFMRQEIRA
ncbi:MAG: ABC transporter permease [Chloroflexi bacterium]|nr:ABC transporter permease [Chloroflexota bacterium]